MDRRLNLSVSEPVVKTALVLMGGIGPATVSTLVASYGTVGEMLEDIGAHAAEGRVPAGLKRPAAASLSDAGALLHLLDEVEEDFALTIAAGGDVLHPGSDGYPALLEKDGWGPVLRIFGAPLSDGPLCGLFGARSASSFVPTASERIAAALHEAGIGTASGTEGPIDEACIREALRSGARHTVILDRGWNPSFRETGSPWEAVVGGGGTLVGRFGHGTPNSATTVMEAGDTLVGMCCAMVAVRGADGNATRKNVSRTLASGRPLMLVVPPERYMDDTTSSFLDYAVGHRNAGDLVHLLKGREDYPAMVEAVFSAHAPSGPSLGPGF
jgi:hypothetical protein